MNIFKLKLAVLAAGAALAVTSGTLFVTASPAMAAELVVTAQKPTARIVYDDLNLRSPAGVERLQARIRAAADKLCVGQGVETLQDRLAGAKCRDQIVATAAPQVDRAVKQSAAFAAAAASQPVLGTR